MLIRYAITLQIVATMTMIGCSKVNVNNTVVAEWKLFQPEKTGFKVMLPGDPIDGSPPKPSQGFSLEKRFDLNLGKDLAFGITVTKMFGVSFDSAEREGVLATIPGGMEKEMRGKASRLEKLDLTGAAVGEFRLENASFDPGKPSGRIRVYVTKNGIVQFLAFGTPERIDGADTQKFFDSIELTDVN